MGKDTATTATFGGTIFWKFPGTVLFGRCALPAERSLESSGPSRSGAIHARKSRPFESTTGSSTPRISHTLCSSQTKPKAVGDFREAIRLDPDSEMAHYRLGQTYRDLNQLT